MNLGLALSLGRPYSPQSGGAPSLPTDNLLLDYDLADASLNSGGVDSLTPAQGSMSGDANAVMTYSWSRPTYTAEDADFSGQPSASAVNVAAALKTGTLATAIAQPSTFYLACRVYAGANNVFWRIGAAGSFSNSAGLRTSGSGIALMATSNTNELNTTIAAGVHLICVVYNGASSAVYIDDVAAAAVSGNASSSSCTSILTGSYTGQAADVSYKWARQLAYSGSHNQSTREAVQAYLANLYGL